MTVNFDGVFTSIGTGSQHREDQDIIDPIPPVRVDEYPVSGTVTLDPSPVKGGDHPPGEGKGIGSAEANDGNPTLSSRGTECNDGIASIPHSTLYAETERLI
jgi:hypothetical protein